MTGLPFAQIAVVEVEIANQRSVIEGSPVHGCPPAPNKCANTLAVELFHLITQQRNWFTANRTKSAAEGIKDANLQLNASSI